MTTKEQALKALDQLRELAFGCGGKSCDEIRGFVKTIRAALEALSQETTCKEKADLIGALSWCIGHIEGIGGNTIYPRKVLNLYLPKEKQSDE